MVSELIYLVWFPAHCLVAHPLCLKMAWHSFQWVWLHAHCFVTHLLGLKMPWDLSYLVWNIFIRYINLYPWTQARVKFYGQKKWHQAQATSKGSFIDLTIQSLRLYLELKIYRCINDEHNQKMVILIEKKNNNETIL